MLADGNGLGCFYLPADNTGQIPIGCTPLCDGVCAEINQPAGSYCFPCSGSNPEYCFCGGTLINAMYSFGTCEGHPCYCEFNENDWRPYQISSC